MRAERTQRVRVPAGLEGGQLRRRDEFVEADVLDLGEALQISADSIQRSSPCGVRAFGVVTTWALVSATRFSSLLIASFSEEAISSEEKRNRWRAFLASLLASDCAPNIVAAIPSTSIRPVSGSQIPKRTRAEETRRRI